MNKPHADKQGITSMKETSTDAFKLEDEFDSCMKVLNDIICGIFMIILFSLKRSSAYEDRHPSRRVSSSDI